MYSKKLMDICENPSNVGTLDKDSPDVGTGMVGSPECGDVMKLQIMIDRATRVIKDVKFKTFGCGSAIASTSLMTDWVKGKSIEDALKFTNAEVVKELELPAIKIHCSILAEDALRAAVEDYYKKNPDMRPAVSDLGG